MVVTDPLDSTNLGDPDFAPAPPVYPEVLQLVKVGFPQGAGSSLTLVGPIPGTFPRIYPGVVQQFQPPLALRDREVCYLFEANNFALSGNKIYDCRLAGSFTASGQTLPLYEAACCVPAGSSSSSGSANGL